MARRFILTPLGCDSSSRWESHSARRSLKCTGKKRIRCRPRTTASQLVSYTLGAMAIPIRTMIARSATRAKINPSAMRPAASSGRRGCRSRARARTSMIIAIRRSPTTCFRMEALPSGAGPVHRLPFNADRGSACRAFEPKHWRTLVMRDCNVLIEKLDGAQIDIDVGAGAQEPDWAGQRGAAISHTVQGL